MKKEIIGKMMEVTQSRNEDLVGVSGRIVDETRNAVVVASEGRRKTVLKSGSTFRINDQIVNGEELAGRPEDRVKK